METTLKAAAKALAIVVAFLATGFVVTWAPPLVLLALAVGIAIWWCIWLERHSVA